MNGSAVRSLAMVAALALSAVATDARADATSSVRVDFGGWIGPYQDLDADQRAQIGISARLIEWSANELVRGSGAVSAYYGVDLGPGSSWKTGAFLEADASAKPDGRALGQYTLRVALDIKNNTGSDLPWIIVSSEFSAFVPYRDGARVDQSLHEYALFSSSLTGVGSPPPVNSLGDSAACDTRVPDYRYNWENVAPPAVACSVPSPDHSIADLSLRDLKAGATGTLEYTLSITVEAFSVIEPISLALLAPPVLALAALRRRRAA